MNWSDLKTDVGAAAPILGTLIGGPAGPAIGAIVASVLGTSATPDDVKTALATNPDAAVKLRQIESDQIVKLRDLAVTDAANSLNAETARLAAVNATMQTEDKSDHWPTYTWRPFIGFCVGFNTAVASILVLAVYGPIMFGVKTAAEALPTLPTVLGALAALNATVLPILGIASYFRGKMQADPNTPSDNRG